MPTVRILEEATEEVAEAVNWYESESPGLGLEFFEAVEAAIDLIEADIIPLQQLPREAHTKEARRLILKRFPYDVVVLKRSDEILVIAVAHHSRKPGYWRKRRRF